MDRKIAILVASAMLLLPLAGCLGADAPTPESEGETPTAPVDSTAPPPILSGAVDGKTLTVSFAWTLNATSAEWSFGDGSTAEGLTATHTYDDGGTFIVGVNVTAGNETSFASKAFAIESDPWEPHVVVAIPDSGINPYHEMYHRPERTQAPCTYILNYTCDVEILPLSIGIYESYDEAFEADRALFENMETGKWYWIPQTVFIGVMCEGSTNVQGSVGGSEDICLIDDTSMHGTGTTSSVIWENPDALLVFKEGNSNTEVFENPALQIDIISYSWGFYAPLYLGPDFGTGWSPFFVAASGNEGAFPVVLSSDNAPIDIINVGGGDSDSQTEPGYSSWKTMDYVSEYCRPTAQTQSLDEIRESYCGTSFSAPTFAGALSSVILELRRMSGYTGTIVDEVIEPSTGISKTDVRRAINHTATYEPGVVYDDDSDGVPVLAPWYQWGWGFYSAEQVPATLDCLLDDVCPERPAETVAYMEALWEYRKTQSA